MTIVIQHTDINVGPASYKHLKPNELLVTKIFYTIQGEGPYAGTPAIFVRLAGCNRGKKEDMGCEFCDTSFQFAQGKRMTFQDIVQEMDIKCNQLGREELPLVVITGGEPMMQDNLNRFIHHLWDVSYTNIQIESNGDRLVKGFSSQMAKLVVSPKVVKGTYRRLSEDVFFAASCLKFVISANPMSAYYLIPDYAKEFSGNSENKKVYLSPLTVYKRQTNPDIPASAWNESLVSQALTSHNYDRAAKLAMEHGFCVSMQQHLFFGVE